MSTDVYPRVVLDDRSTGNSKGFISDTDTTPFLDGDKPEPTFFYSTDARLYQEPFSSEHRRRTSLAAFSAKYVYTAPSRVPGGSRLFMLTSWSSSVYAHDSICRRRVSLAPSFNLGGSQSRNMVPLNANMTTPVIRGLDG